MIDRSIAPELNLAERLVYISPAKQTMSNGVDLYTICGGTQDVMRFVMIFKAGTRYQSQSFVASSTLNMLAEGTRHYVSAEIAEKFDFYGASFEVTVDRDWAILSVYCLTKYCDEVLQIVEELIKRPTFPDKELNTYKQKQQEALRIEEEKVEFLARRAFLELLYGEKHPYGISGKIADYDLIHRDLLTDFHERYFSSSNVFIVLAGKVGDKEHSIVERYFGSDGWGEYSLLSDNWVEPYLQTEKELFIPKQDALQSAIRMGRVLFPKNHPDNVGVQVLNTVLGGYFGSRLMRNIREDKGYTYGIYSFVVSQKDSGYLSIVTDTGVEYTSEVLKEIKYEIDVLHDSLIADEELKLVKQYIFGEMLRTLDGPWGQSEVCIDNIQSGLPHNYIDLIYDEISNITPQRMQQLAIQYLNPNDLCLVVAGGKYR